MRSTPPPIFKTPPQRILIVKPSAIGDVVHALPVLNLLRRRWLHSHVSWLISPACAGLLEGHPQINELIRFDRRLLSDNWKSLTSVRDMLSFRRMLRDRQFDLVIDLQGLFRSGWMTWATGAPVRVGSSNAREFGWIFCTHLAPVSWEHHAVRRYLIVADYLGLGQAPVDFVLPIDDADRRHVGELLGSDEPIAVLLPATHWPTKRWPVEKFAALVQPLQQRFGLRPVVAGGADAQQMASSIPGAISLAGKTNLRQLTALLARADLVIANDTGPMHIASALNRPLVTIFGPTDPDQTGPWGRMDSVVRLDIPCSPCESRTCSHQSCMRWLDVEAVLSVAEKQLRREIRMTKSE